MADTKDPEREAFDKLHLKTEGPPSFITWSRWNECEKRAAWEAWQARALLAPSTSAAIPAPAAPASPDARDAPAEPPVLWCVHVIGPDDLYAFPTLAAAQENAKALTAFMERQPKSIHDPICIPVVTVWPHSPESHAADLRENIFTKPSSKGEGTPS